jgi:HD-GYP domain-containing protein (c-di-GMP phosphodiesterase class II)
MRWKLVVLFPLLGIDADPARISASDFPRGPYYTQAALSVPPLFFRVDEFSSALESHWQDWRVLFVAPYIPRTKAGKDLFRIAIQRLGVDPSTPVSEWKESSRRQLLQGSSMGSVADWGLMFLEAEVRQLAGDSIIEVVLNGFHNSASYGHKRIVLDAVVRRHIRTVLTAQTVGRAQIDAVVAALKNPSHELIQTLRGEAEYWLDHYSIADTVKNHSDPIIAVLGLVTQMVQSGRHHTSIESKYRYELSRLFRADVSIQRDPAWKVLLKGRDKPLIFDWGNRRLSFTIPSALGDSLGQIVIERSPEAPEFSDADYKLAKILVAPLTVLVDPHLSLQGREVLILEVLGHIIDSFEVKDVPTFNHIHRMARITYHLALQMGYEKQAAAEIYIAALLHDIGKIATPDAILAKPDPLDATEWEIMALHAPDGAFILEGSDSPILQLAAEIARWHHRYPDGTGYPEGEPRLSLPVQIATVADVFEALTSTDRPYRRNKPMSYDEALHWIKERVGSRFNAAVVLALEVYLQDDSLESPPVRMGSQYSPAPKAVLSAL